jgi:HAE1 family hydrophobic/amphiphilic exporter-1
LEINQTQKDINAIDQKFYREQTKPQVDFVATFTRTGARGTVNPNVINPISGTSTTEHHKPCQPSVCTAVPPIDATASAGAF